MLGVVAPTDNAMRLVQSGVSRPLRPITTLILLVLAYATVAAASFNEFYQKWGLRDDYPRMSFIETIDGTAHRPFIFRQMLPATANAIDDALPEALKERIINRLDRYVWWEHNMLSSRLRIDFETQREYVIRYYMVYYASVLFLFAAMFTIRSLCLAAGADRLVATLTPVVFGLALPYFFSMGGFFYDFSEIFFMALAFLLTLKGKLLWLAPLTVVATSNKESFYFFTLMLFPLIRMHMKTLHAAIVTLGLAGIAGFTYLIVRAPFLDNPGGTTESWFFDSLRFYANPMNLFQFETNYGIVTPRGYSLATFLVIGLLYVTAWRSLAGPLKQHILLSAGITAVLVLAFCGAGETRNYSLCYMGLVLVIAQALTHWMPRSAGAAQSARLMEAAPAITGRRLSLSRLWRG